MPERTDAWLISTDQTGPCGWWLAEIGSERTGVTERIEAKPVNYPLSVGDQVVFHTQKLLCFATLSEITTWNLVGRGRSILMLGLLAVSVLLQEHFPEDSDLALAY